MNNTPRDNMIRTIWIVAACALPTVTGVTQAQRQDTLPIDAALAQPSFPPYMPISVSPDGRAVAYTTCLPDSSAAVGYTHSGASGQTRGCSVWITNADDLASTRLGGGPGTAAWAPQWSPDGRKVAYYSDQNGVARLWIWVVATRSASPVSDAIVRPYVTLEAPRWTPDSRGIVTRILPYGEAVASATLWLRPAGAAWDTIGRQPGSTVRIYHTDSVWRSRPTYTPTTTLLNGEALAADLALIHIETGVVQTLARGMNPFAYWVSPNGKSVAFSSDRGLSSKPAYGGDLESDLLVVATDSGPMAPHVIAASASITPFGTGVAWSPDGRSLVYATAGPNRTEQYHLVRTGDWAEKVLTAPDSIGSVLTARDLSQALRWDPASRTVVVATDSSIAAVDVASGQWRQLSRPPHGVSIVSLVGPVDRSNVWEPDGASLVVESRNESTKYMGFATISLRTGRWTQVTEKPQSLGNKTFAANDVSGDGRHVAFVSESATEPPDIWLAGADLAHPRRITTVAPSLAGRHYGESRLIAWRTVRGQVARGALLLPLGYEPGHKYPLIIYPYPRDHRSNWVYQFGLEGAGVENMQLFATRGFAVLAPDAEVNLADQMRSLADVLLPGIDQVIAMGIADSARVGVMGHSWGAYTVLSLLVQTERFRAAVMRGGYGDLIEDYGDFQPDGGTYGQVRDETYFSASPWRDLPRYIDNSPVFFLDRIRTPLLIVHGGADGTTPPHEGAEIFADLRRLGQIVEYAAYDGENHGEIGWSIANQRDYLSRIIGWFGDHLATSHDGRSSRDANTAP